MDKSTIKGESKFIRDKYKQKMRRERKKALNKQATLEEVETEEDKEAKKYGRYWLWKDFLGSEKEKYEEQRNTLEMGEETFRQICEEAGERDKDQVDSLSKGENMYRRINIAVV